MSDEGHDEESKTEEPTPKRLEQLRKDGVTPRSPDVGAAVALAVGLAVLVTLGAETADSLARLVRHACLLRGAAEPVSGLAAAGRLFSSAALPAVIAGAAATAVAGIAQTLGAFDLSQAAPKLDRLDPQKGIAKVIPGRETLLDIAKTFFKVGVLGLVTWQVAAAAIPRLALLSRRPAEAAAGEVLAVCGRVLVAGVLALSVLAALDWGLSFLRWRKQARMTKQEVKDEHRQEDGDPKVKAKRRARALKLARERSIASVRTATVLVANPTHVSVALRYLPGKDRAPVLLGKGLDEVALRMRAEARAHRVPIVENRPLARALFSTGKIGRAIPVDLYDAAARVISHVLRLRRVSVRSLEAP
jgi:flagellar biosynthetic protein FlhB